MANLIMSVMNLIGAVLGPIVFLIESLFHKMILWYDDYIYSPLQRLSSPVVARIPRHVTMGQSKYEIFTANIVSYTRTFLVIPIVWLVRYNYCWTAFWLVALHDFLDHLDGIVAKVHKQQYGPVDDPLLGGFMDAFCDKIVNVTCLWSLLLLTDYGHMSVGQIVFYIGTCTVVIMYEALLGVVRVQDYFSAYYARKYKPSKTSENSSTSSAAVMAGKLKEKLESAGIALLCLSQASTVLMNSYCGIAGVTCLLLSIRLAHVSLQCKLNARKFRSTPPEKADKTNDNQGSSSDTKKEKFEDKVQKGNREPTPKASEEKQPKGHHSDNVTTEEIHKWIKERSNGGKRNTIANRKHSPNTQAKVDKVYTVGCFDLFHYGHIVLLQKMKSMGKQVIVGVHDDRSIQQLKNRTPIDNTEKRMNNVKQYADMVFCVSGTNPATFLECMFDQSKGQSCLYVRGNDMPNFPARSMCEQYMPVHFLPYTSGVSSTKLREILLKTNPHVKYCRFDEDDYSLFY